MILSKALGGGIAKISALLIPAGTPGLAVSRGYSKVGWNASDTRELSFTDCRVPAENLLGERGRGYAQFLSILDEGRIAIAALGVGLAQGCVDECLRYAREREAFGAPIGSYQAIQFKIADMEARAHTARLAYYAAAAKMLRGEPFKKEAAIAKLVASNAAMDLLRRRRIVEIVPLEEDYDAPAHGAGPEAQLESRQRLTVVESALAALPAEQRAAILLREIEGLSYAEIGAALEVHEGTVKSRIARAREALASAVRKSEA